MNRNQIRAAMIGVTAGVTAGIVTVAGIIAYDDYDRWDKARHAIARWRLLPVDRTELDRLRAARTARDSARRHARASATTLTRLCFQPGLLLPHHLVGTLQELSVPALITEIERAMHQATRMTGASNWPGHRDALLDEFHRRHSWPTELSLPELDRLRLDAAADHLQTLAATAALRIPVAAPTANGFDYPKFEGPDDDHTALSEE